MSHQANTVQHPGSGPPLPGTAFENHAFTANTSFSPPKTAMAARTTATGYRCNPDLDYDADAAVPWAPGVSPPSGEPTTARVKPEPQAQGSVGVGRGRATASGGDDLGDDGPGVQLSAPATDKVPPPPPPPAAQSWPGCAPGCCDGRGCGCD